MKNKQLTKLKHLSAIDKTFHLTWPKGSSPSKNIVTHKQPFYVKK